MSECVFIFFRDLRLTDNTTWDYCCSHFKTIFPVFIYDPREWPSDNQRQFLDESLNELNKTLQRKLTTLASFSQLKTFLSKHPVEAIASNINYEFPDRYNPLKHIPHTEWIEMDDSLLIPMLNYTRKPYLKFTPFYRYMQSTFRVSKPSLTNKYPKFLKKLPLGNNTIITYKPNKNVYVHGGYSQAKKVLDVFVKNSLRQYEKDRNFFGKNTSFLSAYLSLNVISIRQVYYATKSSEAFIRELYWREFYIHVQHFFPERISKYASKPALSPSQQSKWDKWRNAKTGIDLVDACMNQLKTTGYMHNRGRMIVASYLIKDMKVPFQYGEDFFATHLIDYNKASNNGGWQWVNGTGVDAQPRYQKFNPMIQEKKFDPQRLYITKWSDASKK